MRITGIVCGLLLVAPAPLAAQTWTYARTEHFEVYTTAAEQLARQAAADIERIHGFFADFQKLSPRAGAATRLVVFSGEREYAPYRVNAIANAHAFSGGPGGDYIVMRAYDEESRAVVVHEYTHLMLRYSGGIYPLWLNEGLAEYFSTMRPERGRMAVGGVVESRLQYLRSGTGLMDLERLFAVGARSPEYNVTEHADLFYSQSWALTHMLLNDARYRPGAEAFLSMVRAGTPSTAAIEKAFGRSLGTVRRDLSAYIAGGRYPYILTDYVVPPTGPPIPTRTLDAFEGELVTAQLLASFPMKRADARAVFERLAVQRPDDLKILEARAQFERWAGGPMAARPFLERAVQLGTTNPAVYRDLLSFGPRANSEELLAKAVALFPDDVDFRIRYAFVLLGGQRAGQAMAVLVPIKSVPESYAFQYFDLLSRVRMRLNLEGARDAALSAQKHATNAFDQAAAERLISLVDDTERRRRTPESVASAGALRPPASVIPSLVTVSGRLRNMICGGSAPVLEVLTPMGTVRIGFDDPLAVKVEGTPTATTELRCGKQDTAIRVGYLPQADPARKTVGIVRLLDYRPQ